MSRDGTIVESHLHWAVVDTHVESSNDARFVVVDVSTDPPSQVSADRLTLVEARGLAEGYETVFGDHDA